MIPNAYRMLNFDLGETADAIRDTVQNFSAREIAPRAADIDRSNQFPRDLWPKIGALGLHGITVEEEYGGTGLGYLEHCIAVEEMSRASAAVGLSYGAHSNLCVNQIRRNGNEAQKRKYLPKLISGEHVGSLAMSEPDAGSDVVSMKTRAEKKGDRYVLNGTKIWITGVGQSNWGIVFARTGPSKGRDGVTSFIVEKKFKGFSYKPIPVIRSYFPYEINFEDCEVPEENRLGNEGEGFKLAETWLIHARIPYAAAVIGVAQAALKLAIDWTKERETFGSKLADKQAIQWMIADSEIELRAARLLVYQAAWKGDLGQDIKVDASICKVYATEVAGKVVDRCIQMFGGLGVAREMPLERWHREMRIKRIGEGPSEVHRMVVARDLLGGQRRKA
jgi:alkylation response protein AidB-like acyl-CoA dehydrogenase